MVRPRPTMVADGDPPVLESKNVCVIGAGMAGLAAARELRREGHAVTVMEQGGDVGGQWVYDPRTEYGDPAAPVRVHSSMYACLRLINPREVMGFSDFQFVPRHGIAGRDSRRFPCHREVYCYLREFCDAYGLMDAVRLNTKVLRVAMSPPPVGQWAVRSVHMCDTAGEEEEDEEVFDAVVVATGHYSQPKLPSIDGMAEWRRRQLHSHSYRVPEPFRGEVVVMVGCGDSGKDIALDLRRVAREVHMTAKNVEEAMSTPAMSKMLANHGNLHLHPQIDRLCEDGRVLFADGSVVIADTVIYCTGYAYLFPFLDAGGVVTVDNNRVGPLFDHVFPPSLAPSLSFVGVPRKVFAPWFFEVQAKWVAQVLSGRRTLPPPEEMARSVEEHYRAMEIAGVPKKYTHEVRLITRMDEFGKRWCEFPPVESWKVELFMSMLKNSAADLETYRDDYRDSDSVREALQEWYASSSSSSAQEQQAADVDPAQAIAELAL